MYECGGLYINACMRICHWRIVYSYDRTRCSRLRPTWRYHTHTHTHTDRQMDTRTTQGDDFPRERRKCIATVASCTTYSLRPYSVHMYLLTIQYICSTAPWTRTVISPVVSPAIIAIIILSQSAILCGRPISLELIARVSERPDRRLQETVKDVSVCNVHTAH